MALLIPLIILVVVIIIRLLPKKHHDIVVDMSYEEMISNIRPLAHALRNPSRFGAGISVSNSKKRLEKAYAEISTRVKAGLEIYEFERQLYENFHLVRKLLEKSIYKGYTTLPHKDLSPRIISIAHFIVKGCYRRLNSEKVSSILKAFNKYTPLNYSETSMLKNAILYMLVRDMSIIAAKSTQYAKMKKVAENDNNLSSSHYNSDSYLYYYSEKWGTPKDNLLIRKSDINVDNIENSFVTALIDNCVVVGSIVESIRNIDRIINDEVLLDITPSHQMLMSNASYLQMDIDSIYAYLYTIGRISDKLNVSEKAVIQAAFDLEKINNIHFGEFLFGNIRRLTIYIKSGKDRARSKILNNTIVLYLTTVFLIVLACGATFGIINDYNLPFRIIFSLLIALSLIKSIEHLYSYAIKYEHRFMPRMGYKVIPPEGETIVVVSELLNDEKSVKKAFNHLKILSENSTDSNISYLLLADLKESSTEIDDTDQKIFDTIQEEYDKINKLRINYIVRKRSIYQNKYSGKERKRGALMELSRYLIEGESSEFIRKGKDLKHPEYLIFLDADNELLPGAINRAVNSMLHPLNSKFDLLTFGSATNMHSVRTYYSKKFVSQCGIPDYGKSTDYVYDISMNSIFCGKGIVRLKNFYDKLKGIFPDNRILSHDIIEGAILKTGAMQDRVYEDAPNNIVSDIERKSRWIRGDYQLLPYIFKTNPVSIKPIYRYTIFSNIINALLPAIQLTIFIALLIAFSKTMLFFLLVSLFLSTALDILGALKGITGTIRLRYVIMSVISIIGNTIYRIIMLPFNAVNGLYLFVLTMVRLFITRKNLLIWKTYSSSQGKSNFNKYSSIITPSFIVMTIISLVLIDYPIFIIYTALYMTLSLLLYLTGREIKSNNKISTNEKATLMMYAEDIFRFYNNLVKEDSNYLITDNYQVYPFKGERYSTSPSNIGLSIIAFVSAAELSIINPREAAERIEQIINTITKLRKWNGHLYNWYNTKTLEVLYPSFVSSVDSANFIASLIVTSQFLKKNNFLDLMKKIDTIINNTDFKLLYDDVVNLFYIGYNEASGELSGHYDLIASESRILSYIMTALRRSIIHWMKLSRECVALRGNTLVSWSGTAFEYLMPEIFLITPKYSNIGYTIGNVVKEQIKSRVRGLWGISESGFYRFDEQLNYEYKAFGLRELSLRSDYSRAVITPYSSFLSLAYNPKASISNLNNIKNHSMYGEYGFYEALDMYSGEKPVNSFMAHHLGMSIASIANFMNDGIIRKYFNDNEVMASARLILTEGLIKNKFGDVMDDSFIYARKTETDSIKFSPTKTEPQHNILTNGAYSVITDDYGNGYSVYGDIYLNRYHKNIDSGLFSYIYDKQEKKVITPSFAPIRENMQDYSVTYTSNSSLYHNKNENISMEIFVPPCFSGEVRKFNYYNKSETGKELRIALYAELSVNSLDRNDAHPVFSDLFITTSYIKERNAIIAKRKNLDGISNLFAAIVIKGLNEINIDNDRMSFIGRGNDSSNPLILSSEYKFKGDVLGDTLYPCFGIFSDVIVNPKTNLEFYAAYIMNDNYEKLIEEINEANSLDFVKHAEMASKVTSVNYYSKCIKVLNNDLRNLANQLLNGHYTLEQLKKLEDCSNREILQSIGIDSFTRYVLVDYKGEANDSVVSQYTGMLKYLSKADIKVKLVILYLDNDIYHESAKKHLEDLIYRERGGVIYPVLVNKSQIDADKINLINELAYVHAGKIKNESVNNSVCSKYPLLNAKYAELEKIAYISGEGGFSEDGDYIVRPFNNKTTLLPYSNVIAGTSGGTVITNNGGGYTFGANSREEKLSLWYNDPVTDIPSEFIHLVTRYGQIRINSSSSGMNVIHKKGLTAFYGIVGNISVRHEQYMIKDGKIKVYDTILSNSGAITDIDLIFLMDVALGWRGDDKYNYIEKVGNDILKITNVKTCQSVCIKVFENGKFITDSSEIRPRQCRYDRVGMCIENTPYEQNSYSAHYKLKLNKFARLVFMISPECYMLSHQSIDRLDNDKTAMLDYFNSLSAIKIDSSDKKLDLLFNNCLLYQIVSSRINGKTGFYQSGGAIGFRDQLQDCLALIYSNPKFVRTHILKAAAHQYLSGDVMHWWHYDRFGVRTKIKDDAVFLVYVTAEYIEATSDMEILNEQIPYLESEPLTCNECSRLETPSVSFDKESLMSHLLRAIDNVMKFGEHDLILIGGGDWNDALDAVGLNNRGESVWLTQFLYMTIMKIINFVDTDIKVKLIEYAERMRKAVNSYAYDGKWYRRIYTDRGEWLGTHDSEFMKIDLISQAFAVISGIGDKDKIESAMSSAECLIDYNNGLIKLLDPPFDDTKWYGYISAYPKGVRENGGQYTHGAIWYILALFRMGRIDDGYKLFKLINPIEKCLIRESCYKYMGEPYVLPADVYSNTRYKGRMGWNFYTGSASWCYKMILEEIIGIKLVNNCLVIKPKLPKELKYVNVLYRYKNMTYRIMINKSDKESMFVDGTEIINGNLIPLSENGKVSDIIISIIDQSN